MPDHKNFSEPLPTGAIQRIGTAQFKLGSLPTCGGTNYIVWDVSPDGELMVVAEGKDYRAQSRITLISTTTGYCTGYVQLDTPCTSLKFSADGRFLASCEESGQFTLWKMNGGFIREAAWQGDEYAVVQTVCVLTNPMQIVLHVCRDRDGAEFALQLWDVGRQSMVYEWSVQKYFGDPIYLPRSERIVIWNCKFEQGKFNHVLDARTFQETGRFPSSAPDEFGRVSLDGRYLAYFSGNSDGTERILDADTLSEIARFPLIGINIYPAKSVAFCHPIAGKPTLLFAPNPQEMQVMDGETGQVHRTIRLPLPEVRHTPNTLIRVNRDGRRIVTLNAQGHFTVINGETFGPESANVGNDRQEVEHLRFTADGKHLISTHEGVIRCWEIAAGKMKWRLAIPSDDHTLCIFPNGSRGALRRVTKDGKWEIDILDLEAGQILKTIDVTRNSKWKTGWIPEGLAIMEQGSIFLCGYNENYRLGYKYYVGRTNITEPHDSSQLLTGRLECKVDDSRVLISWLADPHAEGLWEKWSPQGEEQEKCVGLLNVRTWRLEKEWTVATSTEDDFHEFDKVLCANEKVTFVKCQHENEDRKFYDDDGGAFRELPMIHAHETSTGRLLGSWWTEHASHAIVTGDGAHLIVADSTDIRIFDWKRGRCVSTWPAHTILSMCVSPDGTLLATGSWDSTILIWDLQMMLTKVGTQTYRP